MTCVLLGAVLRLGLASLRLRPPGSTSVCILVLRRLLLGLEALARRAKLLSRVIPARVRSYALADDTVFASSQPVNSSFAQLTGTRAVGSRR